MIRSGKWIDIIRKLNSYDDKIFLGGHTEIGIGKMTEEEGSYFDLEDLLPFVKGVYY